jgi:alcohol dehydrogenase YqhD (iron-dependent ADH family)
VKQDTIEHMKYNCQDKFAKLDPVAAARTMPPNGPQVGVVTVVRSTMARYLPHQNGSSVSSDGTFANTVTQVITPTCMLGNSSGYITVIYFILILTGQVRLFFNNLSLYHILQRDMER